jgi:hypothetical protein
MAIHTDKQIIENTSGSFIYFKGTETTNATSNLSTLNGAGALSGPKDTGGWVFSGMIKVTIKNNVGTEVEKWVPSYIPG